MLADMMVCKNFSVLQPAPYPTVIIVRLSFEIHLDGGPPEEVTALRARRAAFWGSLARLVESVKSLVESLLCTAGRAETHGNKQWGLGKGGTLLHEFAHLDSLHIPQAMCSTVVHCHGGDRGETKANMVL